MHRSRLVVIERLPQPTRADWWASAIRFEHYASVADQLTKRDSMGERAVLLRIAELCRVRAATA